MPWDQDARTQPGKTVPDGQVGGEDAQAEDSRNRTLELAAKLHANRAGRAVATGATRQPFVTRQQVRWIAARMQVGSNEEACLLTGVPAEVVLGWFDQDSDFRDTFSVAMEDKVQGVKNLTGQMIPAALDGLYRLISSERGQDVKDGVTLLLKIHGLIDQKAVADKGQIQQLIELLREESPVQTTYRTIEARKDSGA